MGPKGRTKMVDVFLEVMGPEWTFVGLSRKTHFMFRHTSGATFWCSGKNQQSPRAIHNVAACARQALRSYQQRRQTHA